MTLGEIYTRVMWLLYGDTNYPQSTQLHMQDIHQGIIAEAHRKIQQDYNYWFMVNNVIYDLPQYETVLNLPMDFKHEYHARFIQYETTPCEDNITMVISSNGTMVGATYNTADGKKYLAYCNNRWYHILSYDGAIYKINPAEDNAGVGSIYRLSGVYDNIRKDAPYHLGIYYSIVNNTIQLSNTYSIPLAFELYYYRMTTPYTPFTEYEDNVTNYAADAIIYMAVEIEERRRREFQAATYYRKLAEEEILKLRREHSQKTLANMRPLYME